MNLNDLFANCRNARGTDGMLWFHGSDVSHLMGLDTNIAYHIYNNVDIDNTYLLTFEEAKGTDFECFFNGLCKRERLIINAEGAWQLVLSLNTEKAQQLKKAISKRFAKVYEKRDDRRTIEAD